MSICAPNCCSWQTTAPAAEGKKGRHLRFRSFSPIFTIYITNCVLPISRDTNLTPKCSHSLQQFRCVLLLRTENVNVCVVCCRNIRMAKPLADYADRYARFQCPRSKGMRSRLTIIERFLLTVTVSFAKSMSDHFNACNSPQRKPVCTRNTIALACIICGVSL